MSTLRLSVNVCVSVCIQLHFKELWVGGGDHQSDVLFVRVRRTDTDTDKYTGKRNFRNWRVRADGERSENSLYQIFCGAMFSRSLPPAHAPSLSPIW